MALMVGTSLASIDLTAHAGSVSLVGAGGNFTVKVESLKEFRFRNVQRQQKDFSCGSAALSTLLRYHYNWEVNEEVVLNAMYEVGDKDKIRREGFSMLDMKRYLESLGYGADGFRVSLDQLAEIGIPAIALVNNHGYLHFVVIKGVKERVVLIGDPALGLRTADRKQFESIWNGVAFVVKDDVEAAKKTFNQAKDWSVNAKPVFAVALQNQNLSTLSTHLAYTPNYQF